MHGKKRVIRLHRALSLFVALGVTVTIAVAVYQKSGLLSYQLSSYINEHYLKDSPYRFSCGRITGDLIGHITLSNPVLRYQGDPRPHEVFRAQHLAIDYNLLQVLKLKMMVRTLSLDGARIELRCGADGKILLPSITLDAAPEEGRLSPHVEIEAFTVSNLELRSTRRGGEFVAEDILLGGSFRFMGGRGELVIDQGQAELAGGDLPLRSLKLVAEYGPEGLSVRNLEARFRRSLLIASGRYDGGEFHRVQGVFNPLDLSELSLLGLIGDEKGEVGGNVVAMGAPDSLLIEGSVTGKGLGLVFSGVTFSGVVTPDEVFLSSLEGAFFGSRLNGDFRYDRELGSYTFQGVCKGLDITDGFIRDEGVPDTDLNGFIKLDYRAPQEAYEVRGDVRRSSLLGFEADRIRFNLAWRVATGLRVRSVKMSRPGFELAANGRITPAGEGDLILHLTGSNLDYIADYLELPRIGGAVDLSGRVVGPLDRFHLNMNGDWRNLAYLWGTVDSSRVRADVRDVGSDDMIATVEVNGAGLDLYGRRFERPHVLLEASTDSIHVRDFSFVRGDTFVTSDFVVRPGERRTDVLVKHVQIRMPERSWTTSAPAGLVVVESTLTVDSLVLESDGHRLGVAGFYSGCDEQCDVNAWGDRLDLALLREMLQVPVVLEGPARFRAHVVGAIRNPSIELSAAIARGAIDSLSFDRLQVRGAFGVDGYRVDELRIVQGSDSVIVSGAWQFDDSPVKIAHEGFASDAAGRAPVSARVNSYGLSIASLFRAMHQRSHIGGSFDGQLEVNGTLAVPAAELQGTWHALPTDRLRMPPVKVDVAYTDRALTIRSLGFDDGTTRARATGVLPVAIDLDTGVRLDEAGRVAMDLELLSNDLSGMGDQIEEIAFMQGGFRGHVRVTGTTLRPRYSGTIVVRDVGLRVAGMSEVYSDISARVDVKDTTLVMTSITGSEGKKGRFHGSGKATIAGFGLDRYGVDLEFEDFTLSSVPDVESTQGGRIRISSRRNAAGRLVPYLGGAVEVTGAVITKPIGTAEGAASPAALPTDSPRWLCNLDINAPNNVWLKNEALNMELGGKLIMRRDEQGFYFRGALNVLRGSYSLYNNKFRITDGRIDFSTATTLRPDIRISAFTPHRQAGREERRIFLNLSWLSDKQEPEITLSYDAPGYSSTDLWKMLGGQVVAGDAGLTPGAAFDAGGAAQNIASNYLEKILNAQMQNMTIDVESRLLPVSGGGNGEREMSIAVGRYLSEDLYLKYRQGLTYTQERQVDIEYRISNMFLLRSEIIRRASKGILGKSRQATDEINFDIKFRFEY